MTQRYLKAGGIGVVAVLVALAVLVAPVMAAAPTVDSETTDTSTTSELTDGTTIASFDANASNNTYIEADFDSDNASIQFIDPDTGVIHAENTSTGMKETNASLDYYAWNLSHDELATIPMEPGENKSVTVKFINDTSLDSPDTTEITVYLENDDDRGVVYAGPEAAAGNVQGLSTDTKVDEGWFGLGSNSSTTTVEADSVGLVNASGTTIDVIVANTSGEDPFTEADDQAVFWSYDTGELHKGHQLHIEGHKHAVFNSEAADYVVNGYTYAETTSINGHDAYRVHVADDYDGETTLDVKTIANDKYGPWDALKVKSQAKDGFLENTFVASTNGGVGLVA